MAASNFSTTSVEDGPSRPSLHSVRATLPQPGRLFLYVDEGLPSLDWGRALLRLKRVMDVLDYDGFCSNFMNSR